MAETSIEWTDQTWNPLAGCNDKSAGCTNCYARTMAHRLELMGSPKYQGLTVLQGSHVVWTGKITFDEKALLAPLKRKKPTRYFVNSMSDLFHHNVREEWIDRIFAVMALCPQHTFQVLTKRPDRMLAYLSQRTEKEHYRVPETGPRERQYAMVPRVQQQIIELFSVMGAKALNRVSDLNSLEPWFPLPNFWLGVTVENQAAAVERIPLLLQTPAAVKFLSCEPLLGPLDLNHIGSGPWPMWGPLSGYCSRDVPAKRCGCDKQFPSIDWVIVGGESGHGARPMDEDWVRSLRDQCTAAGVSFFYKQRLEGGRKIGTPVLDGRKHIEFPEAHHG